MTAQLLPAAFGAARQSDQQAAEAFLSAGEESFPVESGEAVRVLARLPGITLLIHEPHVSGELSGHLQGVHRYSLTTAGGRMAGLFLQNSRGSLQPLCHSAVRRGIEHREREPA